MHRKRDGKKTESWAMDNLLTSTWRAPLVQEAATDQELQHGCRRVPLETRRGTSRACRRRRRQSQPFRPSLLEETGVRDPIRFRNRVARNRGRVDDEAVLQRPSRRRWDHEEVCGCRGRFIHNILSTKARGRGLAAAEGPG